MALAASTTRAAQKRADRRLQILRAAIDVFAQRGYHGASIDEIIARADIARGTFYLYFASKAAVFDSILDDALGSLTGSIRPVDIAPGASPPQQQLRDNLARILSYLVADRSRAVVLLSRHVIHEVDAAERLERFYAGVQLLLQRALEHGLAMGLVRACDPAVTSAGLFGMVRGVLELAVLSQGQAASGQVAGPQLVDAILDLGLKGIAHH